jgi:lipoteichoic acid synthase
MRKVNLILFLFGFLIYMEIIFKKLILNHIWDWSVINVILFCIPIALILFIFCNLFRKQVNIIIFYIIISIITFWYMMHLIYYQIFDSIFSFAIAGNAHAIVDFYDFVIAVIKNNILGLFILLLPILLVITFLRKHFSFQRLIVKKHLLISLSIVVFHLISIGVLSGKGMYSNYNLYYKIHSPTLMVDKLGLLTTTRLDIKRTLFGFKTDDQFFEVPKNDKNKNKDKEKIIEYNTINIDWDSLIENEKNNSLKTMHEYFKDAQPTNKNDYTGLFKGKNLIYFIAEAFDEIAIDEELTPTLYKMANEGFNFTNFYTPIFLSTIDGEYITKVSLLPRAGSPLSMYRAASNYWPFVWGEIFKDNGYQTRAYHNWTSTYYRRHLSHPNFGYDYYACGRGLNINCKIWPASDHEMLEVSGGDYINKEQLFMTYYLTVSGHQFYNLYNSMALRNWEKVKNLQYSTEVKCYISQHIELDKALASLIIQLEEEGILEDTVIAISSDHWPYGLTLDQINERAETPRNDFFERDNLPFIIWHSGIKPTNVDKLGSSIDILPTILNLFGLEYDSRLLMGKDMFSNAESIVIYSNRSWITDKGKYNNMTKKFNGKNGEDVDNDYIERINKIVYNRFNLSKLILDNDYYRIVFRP